MWPPAERDPRCEHHERKSVSPSQQSWLGLGTGMTEKVVGTLFATSAARADPSGRQRLDWDRAGWLTGPFSRTHLTVADHSGEEAVSMTVVVGDLAGSGVSAIKNGGRGLRVT